MIRLIIWGLILYVIYRVVKMFMNVTKKSQPEVKTGEDKKKEKPRNEKISDAHFEDIK